MPTDTSPRPPLSLRCTAWGLAVCSRDGVVVKLLPGWLSYFVLGRRFDEARPKAALGAAREAELQKKLVLLSILKRLASQSSTSWTVGMLD